MTVIETHGLTKRFGSKLVVDNLSFSVNEGGCYGFLGPNGAGKSTTIKMLTGLIRPTSGTATVLGHQLGHTAARQRMGYLPELFQFQPWMTGDELLNYHTALYRLPQSRDRNDWALNLVGLKGAEKQKVGTYSKGMQQRIGLACAMLCNPQLLLLDEPSSALDPIGRKDMRELMAGLKKHGVTIFLNSHLLAEVETVCDHLTIINKGRIVFSGSTDEALGQTNYFTIKTGGLSDAAMAALTTHLGTQPAREGDTLTLTLKDEQAAAEVVRLLVNQQVDIYGVAGKRLELEEMFIDLIEHTSEQGGASA